MTNYAYIRISTTMQTVDSQKHGILQYTNKMGLSRVKITTDVVSGTKDPKRRKLGEILEAAKKGDNVIVTEISRLGRSMLDVMLIFQQMAEKEVTVHCIKQGLIVSNDGNPIGKMMVAMCSIMAEMESDLISQRVAEGMKAAKNRGVRFGAKKGTKRKLALDDRAEQVWLLWSKGVSAEAIARLMDVHGHTVRTWIERNIDERGELKQVDRFYIKPVQCE